MRIAREKHPVLRLRSSRAWAYMDRWDREVVRWRSYGGDPGSTKYAPLDQINRTNVKNLRIAWRRPAVDPLLSGKDPKLQVPNNFRATPLMIGGVLYSPNGVGLVEANASSYSEARH